MAVAVALAVTPGAAPPAGAAPSSYEAEDAALAGGAVMSDEHAGFSGSGFAAGFTDANKGSARATFAIEVPDAGSYSLELRYANGTTAPKTLSVEADGGAARSLTLPATAGWDTWGTVSTSTSLTAGRHTVALVFGAADTGNVNLDRLDITEVVEPPDAGSGEAEAGFHAGATTVSTAVAGYAGTGYVTGFDSVGARVVRTFAASEGGAGTASIRFVNDSGSARSLDLVVNGRPSGTLTLAASATWATASTTISVRAGVNTVALRASSAGGDVGIDSIVVADEAPLAARGATVPWTTYEAEDAQTTGEVLAADRTYGTVPAEASGRRAVRLTSAGQYVRVTLTRPANGIVLRYSIPDTADGAGRDATLGLYADGAKVADVALTSRYSWVYGEYPYTNVPSQGSPHRYFDEVRVQTKSWPAGTELELRKDASSTAARYDIDLLEAEVVAAPQTAPSYAVSITDLGAAPDDAGDDTSAIRSAISAARSQGGAVWVPPGTFRTNERIEVQGVTILGAGPWHSVLQGTGGQGGFYATGSDVTIADLAVFSDSRVRDDGGDDAAFEGNFGTGSSVQNVWVEHMKVGFWPDSGTDGLLVTGARVRDTFADGMNIHADSRNVHVEQSHTRTTGDDALAMFSQGAAVRSSSYAFNTVQLPMLANGIAIYGGSSNSATDNVVSDTVYASAGITVSTRFGPVPFSGTTTVARNTIERAGGRENNWDTDLAALWVYADTADINTPVVLRDNDILDSTFQGLLLSYALSITDLSVEDTRIDGASYGIELNASGSAAISGTTVANTRSGGLNDLTGYTLVRGAGNSGF